MSSSLAIQKLLRDDLWPPPWGCYEQFFIWCLKKAEFVCYQCFVMLGPYRLTSVVIHSDVAHDVYNEFQLIG